MGAVFLATDSADDERLLGSIALMKTGDYAVITLPTGMVRVWLDVDRVVADIQNDLSIHIVSTWASFDELDVPGKTSKPSR